MINFGVIGYGYWGPNIVRNLWNLEGSTVTAVCDQSPAARKRAQAAYPHLQVLSDPNEIVTSASIDAVAVITPVWTHYELAKAALENGKHVFVEKPFTSSAQQAEELIELAARKNLKIMVDHTFLFTGAVKKIKQLLDDGTLGQLYYIDSTRINLGLFQHDVNVIWDLAPHDLSIVDHMIGDPARSISAWGCSHANEDIEDIAYVNVDYGDRMMATFHVNWLSPVKVRQIIFAGSRKSIIFNELNTTEPVKVYGRGIDVTDGAGGPGAPISAEQQRRLQVGYRTGDVW